MSTPWERLEGLRAELITLQPLPWDAIATWATKTKPLIRSQYPAHLTDFEEAMEEPRHAMLPHVVRARTIWDDPARDFEDHARDQSIEMREDQINLLRAAVAKDRLVALLDGLLGETPPASPVSPAPGAAAVVHKLLDRFPAVATALEKRPRSRKPLAMTDEYDVQYLLGALLRTEFNDVRAEEWMPSYAGGAARADFVLKAARIVIETKRSRASLTSKTVGEELIIDIARYRQHPDCGRLFCFVYDPEHRLMNPHGLETDLSKEHDGLPVTVLIRP